MLEKFFIDSKAAPRLRSGPLGLWLDSFVGRLAEQGYTEWSRRSQLVLAADLGRWLAAHGRSLRTLDEFALAEYVEQRGTQRERRRAAAGNVLAHLRAEGVVPPQNAPERCADAAYTERYAAYMRSERGAVEGTIKGYVAVVREFLGQRFGAGEVDLAEIKTSDVAAYLVERAPTLSPKRVAYLAMALRSFFRFLFVQGETATDLSTVPLTSQTRHGAALPRYLSPVEVDRLLDTCDRDTAAGRRNRAILVRLVRLGLRASEVAALELGDIRWRSAELVVRGKGNRVDRLPLLAEVGEALSTYLRTDRVGVAPTRRVFLRLCAPVREVAGRGAISSVVRASLERAGLRPLVRGAHLLRHTLATQMIRGGASMAEIAEVLRHDSLRSSAIYAKVDFEALRALAQPWPDAGGLR
jgi:site-specific recombinase XerD